jgi:hypothetical protein
MSVAKRIAALGNHPKAREFLTRAIDLINPQSATISWGRPGCHRCGRAAIAWTLAEMGGQRAGP